MGSSFFRKKKIDHPRADEFFCQAIVKVFASAKNPLFVENVCDEMARKVNEFEEGALPEEKVARYTCCVEVLTKTKAAGISFARKTVLNKWQSLFDDCEKALGLDPAGG